MMKPLIAILMTLLLSTGHAEYSFEYTNVQPWDNAGTGTISSTDVYVYAYVPGSNTQTQRAMTVYTRSFAAKKNIYGDRVGFTRQTYGTRYRAWAKPVGNSKYSVVYPEATIGSTLINVNDNRLAIGNHTPIGGNEGGHIWDLTYERFTLVKPAAYTAVITDLNNIGQVVGNERRPDGSRPGFVYSCEGYEYIDSPHNNGSRYNWTIPNRIGENGVVYGRVYGVSGFKYFIATPTTSFNPVCNLARTAAEAAVLFPVPEPIPDPSGECASDEELVGYEDNSDLQCEGWSNGVGVDVVPTATTEPPPTSNASGDCPEFFVWDGEECQDIR